MSDNKYNGWANYATWRVMLEIFDGQSVKDFTGEQTIETYDLSLLLKDNAYELVIGDAQGLMADYATAFLNDVDWYEIAARMNDEE